MRLPILIVLALGFYSVDAVAKADANFYRQVKCLADNAFYEARNQGVLGMKAVIDTTLNRVESSKYPNSVCKVVYQRKQFSWTHQPKQRIKAAEREGEYLIAWHLAVQMMQGRGRGISKNALWYHADYVNPSWSRSQKLKRVHKIKNHYFYAQAY